MRGSHSNSDEDLNLQEPFYQEKYWYALVIIFIMSQ
jgi:hypothetical protein